MTITLSNDTSQTHHFSFEKIQYTAHLQGLYSAVKWFIQFHTLAASFEFLVIIVHDLS